jgi:hypothetical protein
VQRTASATGSAFPIERLGDGHRIRIHVNHRIDFRAVLIESFDSIQVLPNQFYGRDSALLHRCLEFGNRLLKRVELLRLRSGIHDKNREDCGKQCFHNNTP